MLGFRDSAFDRGAARRHDRREARRRPGPAAAHAPGGAARPEHEGGDDDHAGLIAREQQIDDGRDETWRAQKSLGF